VQKSVFTRHYAVLREKVRAMRNAAGLTQRELAKRLGTIQTIVVRVEQGERRLDLIEFYWFCRALEVDPKKAATEVIDQCLAFDRPSKPKAKPRKGKKG
jgi:transcriptional regulator with XRE-family HTH domain